MTQQKNIIAIAVTLIAMCTQFTYSFSPSRVLINVPRSKPSSLATDIEDRRAHCHYYPTKALSSNGFQNPSYYSSSTLSMSFSLTETSSIVDSIYSISTTSTTLSSLSTILSNDNIKQAFSLATFGPQYLWLLMILIPNTKITKQIMGGYTPIILFSLLHLFIVIASASQTNGTAPILEFNGVFDPSPEADPQGAMIHMMTYPNFVTEEWSHVLTWDLFVGRWIWVDGIKRGIFTRHSVLLTNLIGPPGFLLHLFTCIVTGKGIVGNQVIETDNDSGE